MSSYKEYPGLNTYVVIHTEDHDDMGGSRQRDKEIIGSYEDLEEAKIAGEKAYPEDPKYGSWTYDGWRYDINILTDKGKEEYEKFSNKFYELRREQELHPELYFTSPFGEGTITLKYMPELDGPFT